MITLKSCPNCSSHLIEKYPKFGGRPHIYHEIMPGVRIEVGIISVYFVCQNCGLIFQNPRMSDAELLKFYSDGYYRKIHDNSEKEMDTDESRRSKIDAEIIKKYVGKVDSHLDIGGGRGDLLREIGADVKVAVELNINYPKAKGIKIYTEIGKVPKKTFDLVTAIHVLEHVSRPLEYLQSMTKIIGKHGYLVVEVPTWKSLGGPLRLAHLYHFEPDVLKLMCMQAGLKVIGVEFTPHLILICRFVN